MPPKNALVGALTTDSGASIDEAEQAAGRRVGVRRRVVGAVGGELDRAGRGQQRAGAAGDLGHGVARDLGVRAGDADAEQADAHRGGGRDRIGVAGRQDGDRAGAMDLAVEHAADGAVDARVGDQDADRDQAERRSTSSARGRG